MNLAIAMPRMNAISARVTICFAVSASLLAGCAQWQAHESVSPLVEKERQRNGYYELRAVPHGKSKLVLRSVGGGGPVDFSICEAPHGCAPGKDDAIVATVAQQTPGKDRSYFAPEVEPQRPLNIKGQGTWTSRLNTGKGQPLSERGKCGPLVSTLTPQAGHAYIVEFQWQGDDCKQVVFDATDPDAPQALPEPAP